jgi:hypothetical protein
MSVTLHIIFIQQVLKFSYYYMLTISQKTNPSNAAEILAIINIG